MRYDYILFDLDGTLTDPAVGITNSVKYALDKYDIEVKDISELYKFIGPPLWDSFEKYYGFSKEESKKAVEYYREYFRDKGKFENMIYDGVDILLGRLKDRGGTLILATSKPEVFAIEIMEHFDIVKYFTFVAGSNLDGTRVKKAEVIEYALQSCNIKDFSKAVMVGDREHDIIGAKEAGIDSIGVLSGYGSRAEFEEAGADYIVDSITHIEKVLSI